MPYVSHIERSGIKKGRAEGRAEGRTEGEAIGEAKGLREALALGLELRFGQAGLKLMPGLEDLQDLPMLRSLIKAVHLAKDLEAFRGKLPR